MRRKNGSNGKVCSGLVAFAVVVLLSILPFVPLLAATADEPLIALIKSGDIEGFKRATAALDLPKDQAGRLLIEAAQDKRTEIAESLIEKNADVGFVGPQGKTPLIIAAEKGDITLATFLLSKGADINFQDRETIAGLTDYNMGDTALIAAVKQFQRPMVTLLLAHGAEINHVDAAGKPTLTLAVQGGDQTIIEALTDKSVVDHGKPLPRGDVSVLYAYLAGRRDIVKLLVDRGVPVDRRTDHNYSALMAASYAGDEEMVRLFLSKNADPNTATFPPAGWKAESGQRYSFGWTPLMFAAAGDHVMIVSLLLQAHANIMLQNSDGNTAIQLARTENFADVVNVLDEGSNILWGFK